MLLEISIPIIIAFLSLITFFACKFNIAYSKYSKYLVRFFFLLIGINFSFYVGAASMNLSVIKNGFSNNEIYEIYYRVFIIFNVELIFICLYVAIIGIVCKILKQENKEIE